MSGFPPPPPGQFRPPPAAGGGFVPPPPGRARPGPPPPPNAPRQAGGSFAPPPPPGQFRPTPPVNAVAQGMNNMNLGPPSQPAGPPPPNQFAPPPPGGATSASRPPPPGGPGVFQPPPPGQGFQQQNQHQPPPQGPPAGGPGMMQPPPPGAGPPPPGMAPPGAAPGMAAPGGQLYQEVIDYNIKIPERLFRCTTTKIPQTQAIAASCKIPLGGILRPLAPVEDEQEDVATVQPGSAGIIRCKRCRTYINAFVHWVEHGRRWRCNICAQLNDTSSAYFCHLDDDGLRRDRFERPELSQGVVEFIAPAEYMVRPPQEPTYFFVIDVSATSIRTGMLKSAAAAIKQSLDNLPGRTRTKVGFITFDNSVHYYNMASDLAQPQMMVVSDHKELFVPLPDNLLVNLHESRGVVETFLDSLPEMFAKNPVVSQSCLGSALKAAFTVMKNVGGKMCVFQSIMPNLGDGALKQRENQAIMGTPNEVKLLRPETKWYKETALEFSRQQISVDMFLFPHQYMDMAALGELPKLTAGKLHSYVLFNYQKDGQRFEDELHKTLTTKTAFEAVMRIRCTKGMRITNFYGNFNIRGTDLMALPNVNTDSVFGFDFVHDEQNIASNYVTIQAALLYTSSEGQRRIRVMTQAIPVTSMASDIVKGMDVNTVSNLLCKQGVDVAIKSNVDNARMRLQQTCVDIIRSSKGGDRRNVSGYSVPQGPTESEGEKPIPENLKLLPLYTLAMMKNVAFRGGPDVHPDQRIQSHHLIDQMWVETSKRFIYPRLFALHAMSPGVGYPSEGASGGSTKVAGRNNIELPPTLPLTADSLSSNGVFLLDNGIDMFIWVGQQANPSIINSLFGIDSLNGIDPSSVFLQTSGDELCNRVTAITTGLREFPGDPYVISPRVQVVIEGDQLSEGHFFWYMVEDRASFQGGTFSYEDFMSYVNNPGGPAPPGGAPGGASAIGAPRGMPPAGPQRGGPAVPVPQGYAAPQNPRMHGGPPAVPQGYAAPQNPPMHGGPPAAVPQGYGGPQMRGPTGPPAPQRGPPPPGVVRPGPPPPPRQGSYGGPPPPNMAGPPQPNYAQPPSRGPPPPAQQRAPPGPPSGIRPPPGRPGPPPPPRPPAGRGPPPPPPPRR